MLQPIAHEELAEYAHMDDEELVRRYVEYGDTEAFSNIVDRYSPVLLRVVGRMIRGQAKGVAEFDADDLVQDTLAKAFQKLDTFDMTRKLKPWLCQMAVNTTIDCLRRRKGHTISMSVPDDKGGGFDFPDENSESTGTVELRDAIAFYMRQLPPLERRVMYGKLTGFKDEEIAEFYDCSPAVIRFHLSNARRTLGELLLKKCGIHTPYAAQD